MTIIDTIYECPKCKGSVYLFRSQEGVAGYRCDDKGCGWEGGFVQDHWWEAGSGDYV